MTWNETHQRTRIIREVEAVSAIDMTGAVPWRPEWNAYFDGPAGLVAALRARWHRMCEAQLDAVTGEDEARSTYGRLRRTEAGVLAILKRVDAGSAPEESTFMPVGPRTAPSLPARSHRLHFHGGPVLPS